MKSTQLVFPLTLPACLAPCMRVWCEALKLCATDTLFGRMFSLPHVAPAQYSVVSACIGPMLGVPSIVWRMDMTDKCSVFESFEENACCLRVAAGPCLPNGPITQLGPYFTRNPCMYSMDASLYEYTLCSATVHLMLRWNI